MNICTTTEIRESINSMLQPIAMLDVVKIRTSIPENKIQIFSCTQFFVEEITSMSKINESCTVAIDNENNQHVSPKGACIFQSQSSTMALNFH